MVAGIIVVALSLQFPMADGQCDLLHRDNVRDMDQIDVSGCPKLWMPVLLANSSRAMLQEAPAFWHATSPALMSLPRMGRYLRYKFLTFFPSRDAYTHCACRDAPLVMKVVFVAFRNYYMASLITRKELFRNMRCDDLHFHHGAPDFTTCAPRDLVVATSCAIELPNDDPRDLWGLVARLLMQTADCYDHSIFVGDGHGPSWEELLLTFQTKRWHPSASTRFTPFARPDCEVPLHQPFCLPNDGESGTQWMLQCVDSFGNYRRWSPLPYEPELYGEQRTPRKARIVYLTKVAARNMWHFLHVLAALMEGLPVGEELIVEAEGSLGPLAAEFLPLFGGVSKNRCFTSGTHGLPHITLAGYDKGYITTLRPLRHYIASRWGNPHDKQLHGHAVLAMRTPPRYLINLDATLNVVRNFRSVLQMDFSTLSIIEQWQLASSTQVLIGVHGGALTWGAFLSTPAALIELFPYVPLTGPSELCRPGPNRTPWHAYGGIASLVPGLLHYCLLGDPEDGVVYHISQEVARWPHSPVVVPRDRLEEIMIAVEMYLARNSNGTS